MDLYTEIILNLYKNPKNFYAMKQATVFGAYINKSCGDRIKIFLRIKNEQIEECSFQGEGCAISIASASLLTEYLKGKKISEAKQVDKDKIIELIRIDISKNPARLKCALASLDSLRGALESFEHKERSNSNQ